MRFIYVLLWPREGREPSKGHTVIFVDSQIYALQVAVSLRSWPVTDRCRMRGKGLLGSA